MNLNSLSYTKIVCHTAKYRECAVNGLLIGSVDGGKVEITDAIPIQHLWNKLSPVMELALQLIQSYTASNNKEIIGFYEASEYLDHQVSLSSTASQVLNKIRSNSKVGSQAVGIAVDNKNVLKSENDPSIFIYKSQNTQSQSFTNLVKLPQDDLESYKEKALKIIKSKGQFELNDFDSHLENTSIDWLQNEKFVKIYNEIV